MTICIPLPHHQDGHHVILQMVKLLFYATGNSSVSLFLSYGKEDLQYHCDFCIFKSLNQLTDDHNICHENYAIFSLCIS